MSQDKKTDVEVKIITNEDILALLKDSEPMTAIEIAKMINKSKARKKQVNPKLYKLLGEGKVEKVMTDGNPRPKWKLP